MMLSREEHGKNKNTASLKKKQYSLSAVLLFFDITNHFNNSVQE